MHKLFFVWPLLEYASHGHRLQPSIRQLFSTRDTEKEDDETGALGTVIPLLLALHNPVNGVASIRNRNPSMHDHLDYHSRSRPSEDALDDGSDNTLVLSEELSGSVIPHKFDRRLLLASAAAGIVSPALPAVAADAKIYNVPSSVSDKRILITGANTGLGLESAKRLAQAGAKLVLTARTQAKADATLAEVKSVAPAADVKALVLDLANLESIRSFPAKYNAEVNAPLDVLMANAGVMAIPERLTTTDGFERQLGVNHLGHFALVSGMMPVLEKSQNGFRIISVSSEGHRFANEQSMRTALASNLDPPEYSQWGNYGLSKAANILFANELQRRFDKAGVQGSAVSLHPGGVATDLGRYLVQGVDAAESGVPITETYNAMNPIQKTLLQGLQKVVLTVQEGANTQLFLAAAADSSGDLKKDGGKYFDKMKVSKAADFTNKEDLAQQLFEVSERLTGTKINI